MPRTTTAGMYLSYAVETTPGQRPTTGYTIIDEVKSMPDTNPAPASVDSTTLAETEYVTKEPALKDLGDSLDYTVNFTDELEEAIDALVDKQEAAESEGKAVWFCEAHRKIKKATYYTGKIAHINFGESSVGAMLETSLHITPTGAPVREEKAPGTTPAPEGGTPEGTSYSVRQTTKKTTGVEV